MIIRIISIVLLISPIFLVLNFFSYEPQADAKLDPKIKLQSTIDHAYCTGKEMSMLIFSEEGQKERIKHTSKSLSDWVTYYGLEKITGSFAINPDVSCYDRDTKKRVTYVSTALVPRLRVSKTYDNSNLRNRIGRKCPSK